MVTHCTSPSHFTFNYYPSGNTSHIHSTYVAAYLTGEPLMEHAHSRMPTHTWTKQVLEHQWTLGNQKQTYLGHKENCDLCTLLQDYSSVISLQVNISHFSLCSTNLWISSFDPSILVVEQDPDTDGRVVYSLINSEQLTEGLAMTVATGLFGPVQPDHFWEGKYQEV